MLPLFFCANVFYSYQQNNVNGMTFNIRTRSLNGALYWMAQMFGGLLIGLLLDLPMLERPGRARLGWILLFVTGMVIWAAGTSSRNGRTLGTHWDVDYTQGSISTGPIFLYIFYGAYDSLWQSYCYWLMGTQSNSTGGRRCLSAFQAAGGAMAWRINAQHTSAMTQLAMNWGLSMGSLVLALPTVLAVTKSTSVLEEAGAEAPSDKVEEKMVEDS
ncbi:MFS transporter [Colletotrichum tofieldiae]|nr:MFS transporter [Colletotrichum tofieldiae]